MKPLLAAAVLLSASASADPLIVDNGRLFIPAKVGGVETEALLDSGAEATIVDPALAKRANLPEGEATVMKGSGGETQARIVPDVTIEALGVALHPEAVVVLNLGDLSSRLIKRPTQAIVGRELFDALAVPKEFVVIEGGDHNDDVPPNAEAYWSAVDRFTDGLAHRSRVGD